MENFEKLSYGDAVVLCAGFPTALPACNSGSSTLHQCICLIYEILRRCGIASTRFAALHGFVSSRAMARLPSQDLRPLAYTEVPPPVGGITLRCISSTINLTGANPDKSPPVPFPRTTSSPGCSSGSNNTGLATSCFWVPFKFQPQLDSALLFHPYRSVP